jgi:hypothetical protein
MILLLPDPVVAQPIPSSRTGPGPLVDLPPVLAGRGHPERHPTSLRKAGPMEASDVQIHLRRCGVVVHHAAQLPRDCDGRQTVVVFLEASLGQFELARRCALRLPGVVDVSFSGHTRAVMYVIKAESGGRSGAGRSPRPVSPAARRARAIRRSGLGQRSGSAGGPERDTAGPSIDDEIQQRKPGSGNEGDLRRHSIRGSRRVSHRHILQPIGGSRELEVVPRALAHGPIRKRYRICGCLWRTGPAVAIEPGLVDGIRGIEGGRISQREEPVPLQVNRGDVDDHRQQQQSDHDVSDNQRRDLACVITGPAIDAPIDQSPPRPRHGFVAEVRNSSTVLSSVARTLTLVDSARAMP